MMQRPSAQPDARQIPPPDQYAEAYTEADELLAARHREVDEIEKAIKDFEEKDISKAPSLLKYNFARMLFMVVLAGTELDMFGVALGLLTYTRYNDDVLTFFPIFSGLCFFAPLVTLTILTCVSEDTASSGAAAATPRASDSTGLGPVLLRYLAPMNPHGGSIKLYHWVPTFRFYLLVKPEYDSTDVQAIFKINALSTFTFGLYQLFGIMVTLAEGRDVTLYVIINIITQCLNVSITAVHSATGVAAWMGNAATVQNLCRTHQGVRNIFISHADKRNVIIMQESDTDRHAPMNQMHKAREFVAELVADELFPSADPFQPSQHKARRERTKQTLCMMNQAQFIRILNTFLNHSLNTLESNHVHL